MKGVLVILDGLGDLPNRQLDGKTPLEAAETPNLDFFSNRGEMGYVYPLNIGAIPGTDESIVSLFGNDVGFSTRGQLEAVGTDIDLKRGDLSFRANFATIDSLKKGNVLDRRAGRTLITKEAQILAKEINKIQLPCKFIFKPTIQHRAVLVFRGGFSDEIVGNDIMIDRKHVESNIFVKTLEDDENAQYTVNIVNEFLEKAYEILKNHPVNQKRKEKGLLPANFILLRGPGTEPPKLSFYRKWLCIADVPVIKGFAKISGMKLFSFKYPKLKKLDVYETIHKGLKKMCKVSIKTLKRNYKKYDYAYIHIKATDIPGHDNKPLEKKAMIEYIDKTLFNFLRKFAPSKKIKIAVTGDHSTPCKLKDHSADPVPLLLYNDSIPKEKKFSENEARKGKLGRVMGKNFLEKIKFT
ncbi:phosphoglycerate mutase [Candidatus Pacearchaeota archaeon CG10_big_fil_rev_8_21_14_0_10_34_12]|nr:MAG: phosphoglycerate mutase [Candidatus Pacearchaeota archaeon CG10_big_fil_rev_8_21_14_0_10_34_12]